LHTSTVIPPTVMVLRALPQAGHLMLPVSPYQ
jgi:hypothetical protein